MMKRLVAMLAVVSAIGLWAPIQGQAQGGGGGGAGGGGGGGGRRGNFDPAEMRQRMMDRYKESLEVKSDDEWKVIEPRIQKVMDARQAVGFGGGMRGVFGGGPRRGGGGGGGGSGGGDTGGDQAQARRTFGQAQSPAAQDLQKAVESGASADQIKAKLAAYRDEKKEKQEKLEQAQADLKKVLKLKQEAAAVLAGLLD